MDRRSKERVMAIEVYTDGSLKKMGQNLTFGGWGYIVVRDSKKIFEAGGHEVNTTNQRMELQAVYEAIKYAASIRRPCEKIIIYSDSAYLVNCYRQDWYLKWEQNGWRNSEGKTVANMDLWYKIIPYFDDFWYDFRKVTGHNGVFWNEEVDSIAQAQAESLKKNWRGLQR